MEKELIITDIGVASYLIYLEFSFKFDIGDEGIVVFKFPNNKDIKKAIVDYNTNKAFVDPKRLLSVYKRTIIQIFSFKKQFKSLTQKGEKNENSNTT